MTNRRALGMAGVLGLWAALTGCGADDGSNNERSADTPAVATPTLPGGAGLNPAPSDAPARATTDSTFAAGDSAGPTPSGSPSGTSANPAGMIAPSPVPTSDVIGSDPLAPPPRQQIPAGTLTAGTWDDNRNLTRFLDYRRELYELSLPGVLDFTPEDHQAAKLLAEPRAHTSLDISLVIDTTGSMGDELAYLQTEFLAISAKIEASYPDAEQRWSLVVYRDVGDVYTARSFDFATDPVEFRQKLADQAPGGGGDIPEAPDAAFEQMNQLSWRTGESTARLAFWVADAPHHNDKARALGQALVAAQGQGVHIYPVASSGVDELTELTMRSAAQLTGGRYIFLTDDSGVGGAHKEPSIPCYFVTKLDAAILRMVDIEMSGVYHEPVAEEILRSGGDPQEGACMLESGQRVYVF